MRLLCSNPQRWAAIPFFIGKFLDLVNETVAQRQLLLAGELDVGKARLLHHGCGKMGRLVCHLALPEANRADQISASLSGVLVAEQAVTALVRTQLEHERRRPRLLST